MNIDDCLQLQRDLSELEKWTKNGKWSSIYQNANFSTKNQP